MRRLITILAVLMVLVGIGGTNGQAVVINEFMATNESTLTDEDGDYNDWIELYNPNASSVDLDGWYLTDDAGDLTKWEFPSVTIETDEYLLVFASSKDRTDPLGELHTNFKLSRTGEYLGLIEPDGATVVHEYAPAYPPQIPDVPFSYGLLPDGSPEVFFAPSPRAPNIPEPCTLALLGAGAVGLLLCARRSKRR